MKLSIYLGIVVLALAIPAAAQKRPVAKPTPRPPVVQSDVKTAKTTASNQLANVSGYLNKFTPLVDIANGLERDDKAGKLSAKAKSDYGNFKRGLGIQLSDFKVGLGNLENDFKTKPALSRYLIKIQGISDLATTAQNAASAANYDAVRESLKGIVQRLSDTVAALPS